MSESEFIDQHTARALDECPRGFASLLRWSFDRWSRDWFPKLGSPLEKTFFLWWGAALKISHRGRLPPDWWLALVPQVDVQTAEGNFRIDFVVRPYRPGFHPFAKIAIELDGHDFHERTKDQVALRNRRDRALQADGWKVFHFSGSEFHAKPADCVLEVMRYADEAMEQYRLEASIVP